MNSTDPVISGAGVQLFKCSTVQVEQVLLHVIDHGILGLLEKGHNEFLDHVAVLLRSLSLVLRLLNLLKKNGSRLLL